MYFVSRNDSLVPSMMSTPTRSRQRPVTAATRITRPESSTEGTFPRSLLLAPIKGIRCWWFMGTQGHKTRYIH